MANQTRRLPKLGRSAPLLMAIVLGAACSSTQQTANPPAAQQLPLSPPQPRPVVEARPLAPAETRHLLGRLTFGPTAHDLEIAEGKSAAAWLDWQLAPERIEDARTDALLGRYHAVLFPPAEAREAYMKTFERPKSTKGVLRKRTVDIRSLLEHAQMVQFLRQVASERQALEVMVDFWSNHFNIYALKSSVLVLATDYIERAIRPHALGRFEDLLIATAHHPAMLVYLDNHLSSVANTGAKKQKQTSSGITENYARELLELHTLGVHGGYTQQDVIEVARILTGWTVQDLSSHSYTFAFKPEMHDFGSKVVLGVAYPPKRGEAEGIELLKRLAAHPATARHLATKLCVRFVADMPSPRCIDQLSNTYMSTHGDIRALLRALVALPDFWEHPRSKLKSPNLLLVSTFRALGTLPKGAAEHAKLANALGEPKLVQPAPTGYPNDTEAWSNENGMLNRINFAMNAAGSAVPKSPGRLGDDEIVQSVNQSLFAGFGSPSTLEALRTQVAETAGMREKLRMAIALGLGSPDFQYY